MFYYTNMLDSVLFQGKSAGPSEVKLASNIFINPESKISKSAQNNEYVSEQIIGSILPYILEDTNTQLVATLNQMGDNVAVFSDLGKPTGKIDVIKKLEDLLSKKKLYMSKFKKNGTEITINRYIYNSLMSSFFRIVTPPEENTTQSQIVFISSQFPELGIQNFTSRIQEQKLIILLGDVLFDQNFQKFRENFPKEEEEFIDKLNEIIEKFIKNKRDITLGYISGIRYLIEYGSFRFKNEKYEDIDVKVRSENSMKKYKENNEKSKIYFSYDPNYLSKLESLNLLDKAFKDNSIDNIPFIKDYEFQTEEKGCLSINKADDMFIKTMKACLNNDDLFKQKIEMYLTIFPTKTYSQGFLDGVSDLVKELLTKLCKNLNGGRSKLIEHIDKKIRRENKGYLTQMLEDKDLNSEIKKYLIEENRKKEALSSRKRSLNFTIHNGVFSITREMINCIYNICYTLLASEDKRMLEAEGKLTNDRKGKDIWTITHIYDRRYDIIDGKLEMKKMRTVIFEGIDKEMPIL